VLELLERTMLHIAVLSLVLKVVYQDYILEHLSIKEQIALFDVKTPEFELVKALCNVQQLVVPSAASFAQ